MNRLAEQALEERAAVATAESQEKSPSSEPCLCGIPGCHGHRIFSTADGRTFLKVREGEVAEVRFDDEGRMTLVAREKHAR